MFPCFPVNCSCLLWNSRTGIIPYHINTSKDTDNSEWNNIQQSAKKFFTLVCFIICNILCCNNSKYIVNVVALENHIQENALSLNSWFQIEKNTNIKLKEIDPKDFWSVGKALISILPWVHLFWWQMWTTLPKN